MTTHMHDRHHDSDIVADGEVVHVPMYLRDSVIRERSASNAAIVHTGGGYSPGHVYSTDGAMRDAGARARAEAIAEMRDAWRGTRHGNASTQNAPKGEYAASSGYRIGDACTVNGAPGTLVESGSPGWLTCKPTAADARPLDAAQSQRIRDEAYRRMCADLQDAWRPPA
jgi:hypothetical protein